MSTSSSSTASVSSNAETIRAELVEWFEHGDDATGIRFGETRYIPLRVLVPLARAYFVRDYDEDVAPEDVEEALRSMEDDDVSVERLRLVWDGEWTDEEFVTGVGFKNGGGNDAGWAEFVADVMEWATGDNCECEDSEESDDCSDCSCEESDDESGCNCLDCDCGCGESDDSESLPPPQPVHRGLVATDIARFVAFADPAFAFGEAEYMPVLDFQIAVLTEAKKSGEFGDNPHLVPGATEIFATANGFMILPLTMPVAGAWKSCDYIIGISQK